MLYKLGLMKVKLGIKLSDLWLDGNKLLVSKTLKIMNENMEAIIIEGKSLISLFFQKDLKCSVFSSVKNITKPLITKKNWTPKCPQLK